MSEKLYLITDGGSCMEDGWIHNLKLSGKLREATDVDLKALGWVKAESCVCTDCKSCGKFRAHNYVKAFCGEDGIICLDFVPKKEKVGAVR